MKKLVLGALVLISASQSFAAAEVLEGKTALNAKCSVRIDLDKELVSFAGDAVAFGFFVKPNTISEAVKKGDKLLTIVGNDGPVKARLTLELSSNGTIESASYSQRTFIRSQRVKCTELK
jgi:hypothetical protein